jgi:ubiquitin thioesterase protein OTUB1
MTALVNALQVPVRVEYLFLEFGQDLYTDEGSQENMPRSTCWPSRHQVPPDHEVPRVTMLFSNEHYDIIYPNTDATVIQESDNVESRTAESASQDQGASCSGEKSGEQQTAVVESSTGEKCEPKSTHCAWGN